MEIFWRVWKLCYGVNITATSFKILHVIERHITGCIPKLSDIHNFFREAFNEVAARRTSLRDFQFQYTVYRHYTKEFCKTHFKGVTKPVKRPPTRSDFQAAFHKTAPTKKKKKPVSKLGRYF